MTAWERFLADLLPLLDAWDPIGVFALDPGDRPPPGEYADAAPLLARMCAEGGEERTIALAMHRWAEQACGLASDPDQDLALARAALHLWRGSGEPRRVHWTPAPDPTAGEPTSILRPSTVLKHVSAHP